MKIYIFTEFVPFGNEQIIAVGKNRDKVEKAVRKLYPYTKFISNDTYVLHDDAPVLYGKIREYETVD